MELSYLLFILCTELFSTSFSGGLVDTDIVSQTVTQVPLTKIKKFNKVTCLPCELRTCKDSPKKEPVSVDVCTLPVGLFSYGPVNREDCFPAWMDLSKFQQGQKFMTRHRGKIGLLETFSLIGLLAFPELTDILLFTTTNACPMQSNKRYGATIGQIFLWGAADILLPGNPCVILSSLNQVRSIHKTAGKRVRRVAKSMGDLGKINAENFKYTPINFAFWDAFKRDLEAAYTPEQLQFDPCYTRMKENTVLFNQFAYTITQWTFSAISIMSKERALLDGASDEDIDAFQHLCAVVGYIMGIRDEYNIVLQPNSMARKAQYENFTRKYIIPALYHMNREGKVLTELSQKRAFNLTLFGVTLPDPIPVELFGLGMLRLILNIPYKNSYKVSPLNAQLMIDGFDKHVNTKIPPAITLDLPLNLVLDSQVLFWGAKNFGPCFETWKTDCQTADKLHIWYNGPDFNPNGTLSAKVYCEEFSSQSLTSITC